MNSNRIKVISDPEKVDMADDWYQYATLDHFWIRGRFRATMQDTTLQQLQTARLLEIGCGNGLVIQQFEERLNVVVDGSDLNMFALDRVGEVKGDLYCLNIFDKPKQFLNQYDAVVFMDVIEHIEDDAEFLRTGTLYLKKGGLVIINVPALQGLFSKYDTVQGHKRRYVREMIRKLFVACEIEEISIRYWGLSLVPILLLRKVVLKFTGKDKIVSTGFHPPNKAMNWILDKILALEGALLQSPPWGTSVVAVGRYRPKGTDENRLQ